MELSKILGITISRTMKTILMTRKRFVFINGNLLAIIGSQYSAN